jgi:hypothetical protein
MAMQGRPLTRSLMLSAVALAFASSAVAQTADKQRPNATKQGSAKSSAAKAAPAAKRLDFVPGHSVKETATRSTTPGHSQPAQTSEKQGSGCGSQEMDA